MSGGITVTRHCPICNADVEQPADLLAGLAAAPARVAEAMRSPPTGDRDREGWSPGEVASHLADTEIVTAWRLRQTLAEDEPAIENYDQDRWAAGLHYDSRDLATSLETFAAVRAANLELLRMLDDAGWRRAYRHAEYGRLTLSTLIHHKSDHDLAHLRQIQGTA